MQDNTITVVGNVVGPPTLRCTTGGTMVAGFRVASTPRRFERSAGQWRDGETLFLHVSCWRALAEHVAASFVKGDAVVVAGRLVARSYDTADGERRTTMEIEASAVGPDLNRGVARLARASRLWPEGTGGDQVADGGGDLAEAGASGVAHHRLSVTGARTDDPTGDPGPGAASEQPVNDMAPAPTGAPDPPPVAVRKAQPAAGAPVCADGR